ncbi:MAG: SlyX family protein [Leucothrix sp.]
MDTHNEERLNNLEILFTQQEDVVETLNRVVHEQRLHIEILQQQMKRLQAKLTAGGGEIAAEQDEIPPPHY